MNFNASTMLFDDEFRDVKAKACTIVALGSEERIENSWKVPRRNSAACVGNHDSHVLSKNRRIDG